MGKKGKIFFVLLVIISLVGLLSYNYIMHGGERNLMTEKTDFTVTAINIIEEFTKNIEDSNKKYLDKAIEITGTVTSVSGKEVVLDNLVICNLKAVDISIKKNQKLTIKGRVVGYDDLMGEIKLDQCFKAL